jgi:adenylylsulfate kinase-like enzyme
MIYWFTGQPGAGKTVLATKLKDFLQTEKRNWRKDVFHIDGEEYDIEQSQTICYFLNENKCDVVVSSISPNIEAREEFKSTMGESIIEIYVHTNRKKNRDENKLKHYEAPEVGFFDLDTTSDNSTQSFTKLIHHLREVNKL